MQFKDSKTYQNLFAAYAGESQARNKYESYSYQAQTDGYEQIAAIFRETAHNEKEHAEIWLKYIHGGTMPKTVDNLKDAAGGEKFEWSKMYKEFAQTASKEGYEELAKRFELIGQIEKHHEERFNRLIEAIESDEVFKETKETMWICRYCGHIHTGTEAPQVCPTCGKMQAFFERKAENY